MCRHINELYIKFQADYMLFKQTIYPYEIPTMVEAKSDDLDWYVTDSIFQEMLDLDMVYDSIFY